MYRFNEEGHNIRSDLSSLTNHNDENNTALTTQIDLVNSSIYSSTSDAFKINTKYASGAFSLDAKDLSSGWSTSYIPDKNPYITIIDISDPIILETFSIQSYKEGQKKIYYKITINGEVYQCAHYTGITNQSISLSTGDFGTTLPFFRSKINLFLYLIIQIIYLQNGIFIKACIVPTG